MSSAQVIQLFRSAAFDPETVENLFRAYDLAARRLHDRDRRPTIAACLAVAERTRSVWSCALAAMSRADRARSEPMS
jgi:hypothetical protein